MAIHPDIPEICYAIEEEGYRVVVIQRGHIGYWEPNNLHPDLEQDLARARAWVDHMNRTLGVSPAQREAMVVGSMFGWSQPLADPARHGRALPYTG